MCLTSKQYETTKVCDSANIAEIFSVCSACITRDCTAQDVKEPVLIRTPGVGMYDKEDGRHVPRSTSLLWKMNAKVKHGVATGVSPCEKSWWQSEAFCHKQLDHREPLITIFKEVRQQVLFRTISEATSGKLLPCDLNLLMSHCVSHQHPPFQALHLENVLALLSETLGKVSAGFCCAATCLAVSNVKVNSLTRNSLVSRGWSTSSAPLLPAIPLALGPKTPSRPDSSSLGRLCAAYVAFLGIVGWVGTKIQRCSHDKADY